MTNAITPAWQPPSFGRVLLVLAATVVLAAGMREGAPTLNPVLFAVVLGLLFRPVYSRLKQRWLPALLALLIVVVGLSILLGALFAYLSGGRLPSFSPGRIVWEF